MTKKASAGKRAAQHLWNEHAIKGVQTARSSHTDSKVHQDVVLFALVANNVRVAPDFSYSLGANVCELPSLSQRAMAPNGLQTTNTSGEEAISNATGAE